MDSPHTPPRPRAHACPYPTPQSKHNSTSASNSSTPSLKRRSAVWSSTPSRPPSPSPASRRTHARTHDERMGIPAYEPDALELAGVRRVIARAAAPRASVDEWMDGDGHWWTAPAANSGGIATGSSCCSSTCAPTAASTSSAHTHEARPLDLPPSAPTASSAPAASRRFILVSDCAMAGMDVGRDRLQTVRKYRRKMREAACEVRLAELRARATYASAFTFAAGSASPSASASASAPTFAPAPAPASASPPGPPPKARSKSPESTGYASDDIVALSPPPPDAERSEPIDLTGYSDSDTEDGDGYRDDSAPPAPPRRLTRAHHAVGLLGLDTARKLIAARARGVCTLWGEPAERWTIAGIARFLRVEQGDDVLEAIRHLDAYLSRRCETVLVRDVSNMWREFNEWV